MNHKYIASINLVSVILLVTFLGSCRSTPNSPIFKVEGITNNTQELTKQVDLNQLMDIEYISDRENLVAFCEQAEDRQVEVDASLTIDVNEARASICDCIDSNLDCSQINKISCVISKNSTQQRQVGIKRKRCKKETGNFKKSKLYKVESKESEHLAEESFVELPLEIWASIIEYLPIEHVITVRLVCRDFYNLIIQNLRNNWVNNTRIDLKHLTPRNLTISRFYFKYFMKKVSNLKREFFLCLPGTNIELLDLVDNNIGYKKLAQLTKYLQGTNIHTLVLSANNIEDLEVVFLAKHLEKSKIQTLILSSNNIADLGIAGIARYLRATKISKLVLSNNNIGDLGIACLAKCLRGSNIHTLNLSENVIGVEGAAFLAKYLRGTNIQQLNLSHNLIQAKGAAELARHLKGTNIIKLDLSHNHIGDEGITELAQYLPNTHIRSLDLHDNNISDKGIIQLVGYLRSTKIQVLILGNNKIGDEGAIQLARCLKYTDIQTLCLGYNKIKYEGAVELVQHLEGSNIQFLYLGNNPIGMPAKTQLSQQYLNDTWYEYSHPLFIAKQ